MLTFVAVEPKLPDVKFHPVAGETLQTNLPFAVHEKLEPLPVIVYPVRPVLVMVDELLMQT